MVDFALQYAARGWKVFRLTAYKTPLKGTHGFKDATHDPKAVEAMWAETPWSNVALATGDIVVLDADGPGGLAMLRELGAAHGGLPATLASKTPRGFHFFYQAPSGAGVPIRGSIQKRGKGDDGLDIKATGGYVALPPSINKTRGPAKRPGGPVAYVWANALPVAPMPPWLLEYAQERARKGRPADSPNGKAPLAVPSSLTFGPLPSWLAQQNSDEEGQSIIAKRCVSSWRNSELPEFLSALKELPAECPYDDWFLYGAAIHDFDPGPGGLAIFTAWSKTSQRHLEADHGAVCAAKWAEYEKPKPGKVLITKSSIYAAAMVARKDAQQRAAREVLAGANQEAAKRPEPQKVPDSPLDEPVAPAGQVASTSVPSAETGEVNGHYALPAVLTEVREAGPDGSAPAFIDLDKGHNPKPTCVNTRVAIRHLGLCCEHDTFHDKLRIGGKVLEQWAGDLTDNAVHMLRVAVHREYGFDPGSIHCHDAAIQECLAHGFDPIAQYLDDLRWDGVSRLGTWLTAYLGADDTALNRTTGALALVAAARRVKAPGSKFDTITVLVGDEGRGKSSAVEIMAGAENFSDQPIMTLDERAQQEAMQGVWLYEIADLAGMGKADVERVKAFASRRVDRARPAYARSRMDRPRRCVFFGTTNSETFLKSQTGNRRFWPVQVGRARVDELARDRDMLWAEAVAIERAGVSLTLPERLWGEAARVQAERLDHDPWETVLQSVRGKEWPISNSQSEFRITTRDLLELHLRLEISKWSDLTAKRLAYAMRRLGWQGPVVFWDNGASHRGYRRAQ